MLRAKFYKSATSIAQALAPALAMFPAQTSDERSSMLHRKHLLLTAVAGCAAVILTACGGSGAPSGGASNTGASGDPVAGGEGRIIMLGEPRSMDPAALGNAYAVTPILGNALYGTLMTDDEAGEIQYSLAESFTTNDGGATFELKLRSDLVFSDGTPLNADAVKFNWDRLRDPSTGAASIAEASMATTTKVIDKVTLKVTMAAAVPRYAYSVITSSMNWIASPAALQRGSEAFNERPIGAGPFTLTSWARQAEIKLAKNSRYWDTPKPYLDALTISVMPDANQRYNTVLTDAADVASESNRLNLAKAREQGLAVSVQELNGGIFLALNSRRAPFDDIRARQAVAAALDLDALNLAVYNGKGEIVDTLFRESSPFYKKIPLHKLDKNLAQQLFDELAAEGKPVSFTFSAFPSSENRAIAENVQAQLSAFDNVKVEIAPIDLSKLGELRQTYDFDAILSAAFFRDPEPQLWTQLAGGSTSNLSGVKDPEFDDAVLAGRTSTSEEERGRAYETVQRRLTELNQAIFITRVAPGIIAGKEVGGLVQYGSGSPLPEEMWIR